MFQFIQLLIRILMQQNPVFVGMRRFVINNASWVLAPATN